MRKLTALAIASTLLLGGAQLASAADSTAAPSTNGQPAAGGMIRHHEHPGPMVDYMFKGLNLTTQQRQQMRDIFRESRKEIKMPSQTERQQMHDIIASDSFDSTKAQTFVNSISEEQNQRMLARLEMQNKMYNVLTPEQKQTFNTRFQQHSDKLAQRAAAK
ncbi:ATP-independent periplasmic protein-refolding chaperone Spy [Martelella alba]|uniref:ATP-independent periplasmic protein-refolding chaperone n=1 Tax=Martelella alba TaxID=2590451 RepID=A0ABY2SJQ6_9HYPH|nr:ATP-independent periplasmic protein-refolding chaperone Spy [Martelella alba]TKI05600.1 ATP-independent periplasmic protein-refolding chaperone [Martelella alba]